MMRDSVSGSFLKRRRRREGDQGGKRKKAVLLLGGEVTLKEMEFFLIFFLSPSSSFSCFLGVVMCFFEVDRQERKGKEKVVGKGLTD